MKTNLLKDKPIFTDINRMKYQNGKIYAIRSNMTDKYYIGSTTQPLHKRLYEHKTKEDCSSSYIFCFPDVYIELIENYPCNSKEELHRREGELIRENICKVVNKTIPGRSKEELKQDKKNLKEMLHLIRSGKPDIMSQEQFDMILKNYKECICPLVVRNM